MRTSESMIVSMRPPEVKARWMPGRDSFQLLQYTRLGTQATLLTKY